MKPSRRSSSRLLGLRSVFASLMLAYGVSASAELTYFQDLIIPGNVTNPGGAPSTLDARFSLLPQYDMFTSGAAGSSYDPNFARLDIDQPSYDVRTFTVSRGVVELNAYGAQPTIVTLSNSVFANPSLVDRKSVV